MKTTALLLFLCALAAATPLMDKYGKPYKVADKAFLEKQKSILRLFRHVFQINQYDDQHEISKTYHIEDHVDSYLNKTAVKHFVHHSHDGFLPRGEPFSIFHETHKDEAVALFHVMYYAKDWDTFYKTACWARDHMNEGMFVYAMHAAVLHRHDCEGLVLPPIYEIFPHYFVHSEVIEKAYEHKMMYDSHKDGEKSFHIHANYTGENFNHNPLQRDMSYFMEDVGMNAFYYYFNLDYPFWMGGEDFGLMKDRRGELFYYVHQQLLARYYMERLSHHWGSVPIFDWEEYIKTGYVPHLRYPNGYDFPTRPAFAHLVWNPHNQPYTVSHDDNAFEVMHIEDYERRIRDAVDFGYVFTEDGHKINIYDKNGFDTLGRLVEASPDSPNARFFGDLQVLAHQVLGYSTHANDDYKVAPSAMEHFETAMRDPIFYQFYKRITYYFLEYKRHLPHYTYTDLHFTGVKIDDVHVDKMVTYFDHFDFDITNALYVTEHEWDQHEMHVWARTHRLNHKPFSYKVTYTSDKEHEAVVRVFLGPKHDEHDHEIAMHNNWKNFVELDKFEYHLTAGKHVIERNCMMGKFVKDRTTYSELYKHVLRALEGKEEFHLDMTEAHNAPPNRLMLPMGDEHGMEFQLFVFISPLTEHVKHTYDDVVSAGIGSGSRYIDTHPFGYPLDRPVHDDKHFFVPNSYMTDVHIYHKTEIEINAPHAKEHHH